MTVDEDKIASLYQQGKDQQPPEHLDRAILQAAHAAVADIAKNPVTTDSVTTVKSPFSGGWPAIASIAAVLVISVVLVPLIIEQTPSPDTSRFADEARKVLPKQDSFSRVNDTEADIEEPMPVTIPQIKKRSQAAAPATSGESVQLQGYQLQQNQLQQAPLEAVRSKSFNTGKTERARPFAAEEPVTPMAVTKKRTTKEMTASPDAAGTVAPSSATMNSMMMQDTEGELATGLVDDKDSPDVMSVNQWLKKIRDLIDQGDLYQARQALDEFKTLYPEETVDPLIVKQLKAP